MIEFVKNYTEKFINITPDNYFNYQIVNQYGPWVATLDIKSDVDLLIASPKMAEYMMGLAKELSVFLQDKWNDDYKTSREELKTILSILKDAGIEVV